MQKTDGNGLHSFVTETFTSCNYVVFVKWNNNTAIGGYALLYLQSVSPWDQR
jgi:hypothetical protein